MAADSSPNPAPHKIETQVFVFRETIALLFVVFWLILFAGELVTGRYEIPFWFHCVGVGVMAYALGINVAQLTSFRDPSAPGTQLAERREARNPPPPPP